MDKDFRILIVEDVSSDAELTVRQLRNDGMVFSSRCVETKDEFLDAMENFKPDVILLDYNLPQFNALSALAIVREKYPETPCIIVTGTLSDELAVETMKQGAVDYVLKNRLVQLAPAVFRAMEQVREKAARKRAEAFEYNNIFAFRERAARKRAEEAIASERILLRTIIDNIPIAVYAKDRDGRKLLANFFDLAYFNKPESEVIGHTDMELLPKEVAERTMADDLLVIRDGEEIVNREELIINNAGESRWLLTSKIPLRNMEGNIVGLVGIGRDITERKLAEDELKKHREHLENIKSQLEASNKELDAFSYSVSHDLRSPLRAIDGFSRILLEDYSPALDEEGKRLLNVIRTNTQKMAHLIDDLLSFSRTGRKEMTRSEINMESLAQSVIEELKQSAGQRTIEITVGSLPHAVGDAEMIRQVFANLLSNAFKFTRKNERAVVQIEGRGEGDENVYSVRDNGVGFDMEYQNKLFGIFQRLHSQEEFEGTGVGLAIVQRIIHRHGGRVWAEGTVNEGACVSFILPVKQREEKE